MPIPLDDQPLLKVQPKIYIVDFAVKNAIHTQSRLQIDHEGLNYSIETSVFRQLRTLYDGTDTVIGHSRQTSRRKQIDIVTSGPGGRTFVDIRYQDDSRISRSDPCIVFSSQARQSMVLTKKEHDFGPLPEGPENLYRIPAHAFLYLLGHHCECIAQGGRDPRR